MTEKIYYPMNRIILVSVIGTVLAVMAVVLLLSLAAQLVGVHFE